jgi:hypothetical protein
VLLLNLLDRLDLAVAVKLLFDVSLCNLRRKRTHIQRGDALILRRLQLGHLIQPAKHLLGHRIIHAIVPVLDILVCQVARGGHLMPVWTLPATLALALHKEAANLGSVPLVVGSCSLKLQNGIVGMLLVEGGRQLAVRFQAL